MIIMKYENHRHFLSEFSQKIIQDKYSLNKIEKDNIICENITQELGVTNKNIKELTTFITLLTNMRNTIIKKKQSVKQQRLEILEVELQNHLNFLFPEENFNIKIRMRPYRGKECATLLLGRDGHFLPTKGQNGRLARQMIAVTCLYVINKLKGSKTLFFDEPFSCGDLTTIANIKPIIEKILDDDMQIILVDNTHKTYEDLTRRIFYLEKDRVKDELNLKEVSDVECERYADSF